ncbi:MAG: hypothetical protein LBU70_01840 [Chitinispirillales bacterium]|jgi:hypothetical protein|nr:hypothetical protein [Chitinispirillales bacterium]
MKIAAAEKAGFATKEPYHKVIALGNGVMFPVNSEDEADFVEWMVEEAKGW